MGQPSSATGPVGQIPSDVHAAADYERLARSALPHATFEHVAGGSGADLTVRLNVEAFARTLVTPRVLRPISSGDTLATFGGVERPHPILLAPVAHQALFHPLGELETARAAAATRSGLICSTLSSRSLEDIAAVAGPDRWFQLYVQPVREATLDLVRRAEAAGYGALVVTVDTPVQAPSLRSQRAGFRPDLCVAANLTVYGRAPTRSIAAGRSRILQGLMADAPSWDDLDWLIGQTRLPVWIKGVMHPDDAQACLRRGASGVIVSNHGGRSLDGAPSALSVLPKIRAAVGADAQLLFDGGIRSGADVFRAIALGADAVLVGRLQAYALAVAGALGVGHMIKLLREELELCMAQAGCATLAEVRRAEVVWSSASAPEQETGEC